MLFYRLILISFSFFVLEATPTYAQEMRGTTIKSSSELDYPPFSVVLKDGTASGFSVELLKATLETMGKKVEFNVDEWSKIKQALKDGKIDVLPAVGITDERKKYYDFTIPYIHMHGAVFTRDDYQQIKREEDINNKILVVMKDDNAEEYLKRNNIGKEIITFSTYSKAFNALSAGKYDAIVVQKLIGIELLKKLKIKNIKVSGFLLHGFEQKFCFAVKNGDKELLSLLNEGLSIIISNGTHERIYKKWFQDTEMDPELNLYFVMASVSLLVLFLIVLIGGLVRNRILKKRVLEKTREQEKIQSYLDVAQVLIMALDNNQNVTMINKKGADILGYKKEDIIGKNFIENFIPKIIRQDISNLGDKVIKQKEINTEHENHILTKSGQERLLSWKNSKLLDDEGHTIGILTAGEDITDKREKEKKYFEQSNLAHMGEMISMIAHQWRQPLSSISSISSTLSFDVMMDNYKKDFFAARLNSIAEISQHLSTTIDDFRNFYKPDKKVVTLQLEELVLKPLSIIRPSLFNNDIEIIEEYNSKEEIEVYDNEMIQVILNLFKNAQDNFQENETKDPYIKIITENRTITICDNGGGIPEDIIEKIFDPYFSTKEEKNGTGLGLHMSKTIIEDHHNGKLNVENRDGGVCFIIEL